MALQLMPAHIEEFGRDGYTVVRGAWSAEECDEFVDYMLDLQAGRKQVLHYDPRDADDWERIIYRSHLEPYALQWMVDTRLREPLTTLLGGEPECMQGMYNFKGTEQRWHQDEYHLPGCIGVWSALVDVNASNGTLQVQVGSHKGPAADKKDFRADENGKPGRWQGWEHEDVFDEFVKLNGMPEVSLEAEKGDLIFFHRRIIHRGGPILEAGSFRHSFVSHYIPMSYDPWPYEAAPRLRVSFDRVCRFTPTGLE